jgi:glycosyltransferase involved in cell wall biosynthesis
MALLEAMALGLPVVSFDCPSGPADIVTSGSDGVLVAPEDTLGLAAALTELMRNEGERRRLGENARAVAERFSPDAVMRCWESLLEEL